MTERPNGGAELVPLREWLEDEAKSRCSSQRLAEFEHGGDSSSKKEGLLRKTTVAYGIARLLERARSRTGALPPCTVDNFAVRTKRTSSERTSADDIEGLGMVSPPLSCDIFEPSFLFDDDGAMREDGAGRYLDVEFLNEAEDDGNMTVIVSQTEEDLHCHLFGVLLYELMSTNGNAGGSDQARSGYPAALLQTAPYAPLADLGFPSSICTLVRNLLECTASDGSAENPYESLDAAIGDLHLLLLDPERFLFDIDPASQGQLLFRENKLYGREDEELQITEAFCRVSNGRSEALLIGGYSGSGKSMLVNSLVARVDMSGGYVVAHKCNQVPRERPLLEIISVFNRLCLLIVEKRSQEELLVIATDLADAFGNDIFVLARLLPSIGVICPNIAPIEGGSGSQMNLQSICFTLQRFLRVVSSRSHPVMLFLDDLQWFDDSALAVVDCILSDPVGSSCALFVGCYRSNEVGEDHEIFTFAKSLKGSGVPVTTLSLEGLTPEDLNTMISDAACTFPRICRPLSDAVFQKTAGNPFFVLTFLRSLVDGGLLRYDVLQRRWIWDLDQIGSTGIPSDVMNLLSSKMSKMPATAQLSLKVAACFGATTMGSVVEYLSASSEYTALRDGLHQAVSEGFMTKAGNSDFTFVHDKFREAAYSLIPDSEKHQYHYSLGMSLYMATAGNDLGEIIFCIADQINFGLSGSTTQNPALRLELAKLNELAGRKAVESSDYATACRYLSTARPLLPADCWKSHYNQVLGLSFLLAKSAFACGVVLEAKGVLEEIIQECHCMEDKLPAYFLIVTILNARGNGVEAYTTCRDVLAQIGEVIPQSVTPKQTIESIMTTSNMTKGISENTLLEMEEMDEKLKTTLKFLCMMTTLSFAIKPAMYPFLACRVVQLTMEHGVCTYSMIGFVQFAAVLVAATKNIRGASCIGKAAMSVFTKRFYSAEQVPRMYRVYYGLVACHTESLQSCADMLCQAFVTGMTLGECAAALSNSLIHTDILFLAGENLPTLLKRVDYYLELSDRYKNKFSHTYLLHLRGTISVLIDKGGSSSSKPLPDDNYTADYGSASKVMNFHRAIQAFWLGHNERCHHFVGKAEETEQRVGEPMKMTISFLYGLNAFHVMKRQSSAKVRAIPGNSVSTLKAAEAHSSWNFSNKVQLLEAEIYSFRGKHQEAKEAYTASIETARSSRFVHEQGLACELAGHHCRKIGDDATARSFYNQAKQCYLDWGSQMKVDCIDRALGAVPN